MKVFRAFIIAGATAVLLTGVTGIPAAAAEPNQQEAQLLDAPEPNAAAEMSEARTDQIMDRLAWADPQEAERLAELREQDPNRFKAELRRVVQRESARRLHEPRGPRPPFVDEPPFVGEPPMPPPPGPGPTPGGGQNDLMQHRYDEFLEWLGQNYPEEAEQLRELRQARPDLYERRFDLGYSRHQRVFEAARENPKLAEALKERLELKRKQVELLRRINLAPDKEKQELIQELKQVLLRRFDAIVRHKEIEYEYLLEKLAKIETEVKEKKAVLEKWKDPDFKQDSVKARLEELVGKSNKFDWD